MWVSRWIHTRSKTYKLGLSLKRLRGFLELIGYYHNFIKDYRKIATPLIALVKKNVFTQSIVAEESFQELKTVMCSTPILAMLEFSKTIIKSDASRMGISVILIK